LLNGTLQLQGVDNVESLARRVLDDRLRASSAFLNPVEYEDALSYMVAEAWVLSTRYDPAKGTQSFSTYAYRILWRRVASWYRQRFGDTRYRSNPVWVSFDEEQDGDELGRIEHDGQGEVGMYSQINVAALSPDGRKVLERILEPMVEQDLSLEQVADRFGYSRRWVSRALDRLRAELAYLAPIGGEQ
jgi:RNA polymerase sigma factor (sigma-70 family)